MRKTLKSFWGFAPIVFLSLCVIVIVDTETVLGYKLRIIPRTILIFAGVGSFGMLLLWANLKYHAFVKKSDKLIFHIVTPIIRIVSISVFVVTFCISSFFAAFTYNPEHIVVRNNIKMVATVRSFLKEEVDYHQYKNPLFYGKLLGHEDYGNGSADPLTDTPKRKPQFWIFYDSDGNVIESSINSGVEEQNTDLGQEEAGTILEPKVGIKKLDINVLDNRENELVFNVSIDDYIESYNGYYWKDHSMRYLSPSKDWQTWTEETSVHSTHETRLYYFRKEENVWALPTITVYAPTNANYIQEINVNYDWHSHTESMYDLYKEMCFYTLKAFFPDFSDEQIINLYTEASSSLHAPSSEWYSSDSVPYAVFYKGAIGIYSYSAIGSFQSLCIIPVTQETIDTLRQKGSEIYEIS